MTIQRQTMRAGRSQNLRVCMVSILPVSHPASRRLAGSRRRACAHGQGPAAPIGPDPALEIRSGSGDPLRIMARSELGRLTSIQRTAKLIGALLSGRELTRADVTGLLGVRVAAADRQLGDRKSNRLKS